MKIGEVWKRNEASMRELFKMGAHPISIGSCKVKITNMDNDIIFYRRLEDDFDRRMVREQFVGIYERDYNE